MLRRVLRRIYEREGYAAGDPDGELYSHILESFNNAVDEGRRHAVDEGVEMEDTALVEELKRNNEVFAAFRTHRMERDMASQLTDEAGRLKSFEQYCRDVEPITAHHVKAWLRTEYNTAVIRAHQAVAWKEYERRADVLPNLRWMPSTSVEPGADHKLYWGTVLPIDHPFWNAHRPGDRWNCKCALEPTDDDATAEPYTPPGDRSHRPARGLENNPGKDGRIFSDKHPYFAETCGTCPFGSVRGKGLMALSSRKRGDCYECRRVKKTALGKTDEYIVEQFAKHKVEVESEKLTTGKMVITAKDATSYLYHAPTATMKNILLTLEENVGKLKWNDDFEPLRIEGKNPNNVKRKQKRGVVGFSSYNYEYNGQEFIIGLENRGNRYEVPYFIVRKKRK